MLRIWVGIPGHTELYQLLYASESLLEFQKNLALATKGNAMKRVTYIIPAACSVTINILLYCRQIERQQLHKRNSSRSTCRGHLGTGDGAVKWYRCCRGVTSIATRPRLVGFHMTNFGTTSRIVNCGPRLREYR